MNDFLHNLRNGNNEKKQGMARKTQNKTNHFTTQRSHSNNGLRNRGIQHLKRPFADNYNGNQKSMDDVTPSLIVEAIDSLNGNMEILSQNQKYLVKAQERTAEMMERQVIAIEKVLDRLNIAPEQLTHQRTTKVQSIDVQKDDIKIPNPVDHLELVEPIVQEKKKSTQKSTKTKSKTKLLEREEIMDIIRKMRKEGATFGQVAKRLIELGQPTFSGRGEWHAQTVHRIFNNR
jgi:hypothetical protein